MSLTVHGLITTITADIAPSRRRSPIVTNTYTPRESFQPSSFLQTILTAGQEANEHKLQYDASMSEYPIMIHDIYIN